MRDGHFRQIILSPGQKNSEKMDELDSSEGRWLISNHIEDAEEAVSEGVKLETVLQLYTSGSH